MSVGDHHHHHHPITECFNCNGYVTVSVGDGGTMYKSHLLRTLDRVSTPS